MEVRVQKKKNKFPIDRKKLHTVWKVIAAVLAICVLAGGIALLNRQEEAQAASYNMEIDPATGKPIFNIVEVVPEKNLAVLNLFIKGEEEKTISMDELERLVRAEQWSAVPWWAANFIYWEGKPDSKGNEPFSLIYEDGKKKIINNEIFRLYMLGNAKFDSGKSVYQNYLDNRQILEEFNENYIIKYQIVTPGELDTMNLDTVNYIQIGAGTQISEHASFYQYAGTAGNAQWHMSFKDDFKWETALNLYYRVLARTPRLSISISSYSIVESGIGLDTNMYRLYQMLNYFDDPSVFNTLLKKDENKPYPYISLETGRIYYNQYDSHAQWDDNLNRIAGENKHVSAATHRDLNYIPEKYDNILIYNQSAGYFDKPVSAEAVNKILQPSGGNPPEETGDGSVKVLEIEPCNSYWLSVPGNLSKLAAAIDVSEDDISVTYVTPNTLNGMAVDLTAEYDLILIGENTSLFNSNSSYMKSIKYRHIGSLDDAVVPQTLLNGLLAGDYTTKEKFDVSIAKKQTGAALETGTYPLTVSSSPNWNAGLREQWPGTPNYYFLKNVELALELQALGADEQVSRARFSGNDITAYMQGQLAEFVKSGQPVIVADQLLLDAKKQISDFMLVDMDSDPHEEERSVDARLYYALYGMEDEKEYYKKAPDETYFNTLLQMNEVLGNVTGKTVTLKKDYKASVVVKNSEAVKDENGGTLITIAEKGTNPDTRPELAKLVRTNTLTFDYEITLPQGDNAQNIVMTVVIDRNGDGIFDEAGDGTSASGKPGTQNNATDTIKNDQVFTCRFAGLSGDSYILESGILKGTYTAPLPVDSIEEICQFQVKISTQDKSNPLYGVWTGYVRPDLKKKEVKILQITPYSDSAGGKSLEQNSQFTGLLSQAELNGGEYHFDVDEGFESMSEGDFSSSCEDGSITAESLGRDYDLIIIGTDFNQIVTTDRTDLDFIKAAEVLRKYTDELKRPVIVTNDAFSYVNAENYYAPEEVDYYYRNMTIEEGQKEKPTESDSNYRKVLISQEQYNDYVEKNKKEWDENKYNIGDGTVYLDPEGLHPVIEKAGSYKALLRPTDANDGRNVTDTYIGWNVSDMDWIKGGGRNVKTTGGGTVKVSAYDFYTEFRNMVYRTWSWVYYYYVRTGYVTESEIRSLYENSDGSSKTKKINWNTYIYVKDLHASLGSYEPISKDIVNEAEPIVIAGDTYYKFKSNDVEYLAIRLEEDVTNLYSYVWQKKVIGDSDNPVETRFKLNDVAGKGDALYPSKNAWNYLFTQSLRYIAGMDRFAVTTDIKPEDKRDKGSSRRWTKVEELQGYTNGTLLEYALIPENDSGYEQLVNTASPYNVSDSRNLALGVKPRAQYIEPLNEGRIGLYPFMIADEESEAKVQIAKNHAPYYQLDLERELGKGKIDDVTVWYTLAGSGKDDESRYFDTAMKDAGNNYYLYSKGKLYYTGFSLYDNTKDSDPDDSALIPDMEMKLFINTIYAALTSVAEESSYYDTVVQEGGAISGIELAGKAGSPNHYTYYYDEYDQNITIPFRIQKRNAAQGETVAAAIGRKEGVEEDGLPVIEIFDETAYTIGGLPGGMSVSGFPVVTVTGDAGHPGSLGSGVSDVWYQLSMTAAGDMDAMTIVIGVQMPETGKIRADSIYAEIRLVKRNLFELD